MSGQMQIPDANERSRALDPEQSFIVQAPAGSGKTGLLIQRYLKLLARVGVPEEVVAITFTRKAAAEMRERILIALEAGKHPSIDSNNAYEELTHQLAQAVLHRDQQLDWHITDNPLRLRIQTIDSLCASFTRQMPILSKFGAQLESTEDASELYLEAAHKTIELVESDGAIAQDLEQLLEHLDNDVARIASLLAEMLAGRDHWLRHVHGKSREELEAALQNVQSEALSDIAELFPLPLQNELQALLCYATANLASAGTEFSISFNDDIGSIFDSRDLDRWRGMADLLVTKDSWRKQLTVRNGFPAGKTKAEKEYAKSWKDRGMALIEALKPNDSLCQALLDVRSLPPSAYTDKQWQILGAITRLLPYAVGQLKVIFQTYGKVDFTEVAQGALHALGDPEMPTDLALALDYRIQHLLIDEFQDTSISQYQLVEKMIAGWMPGDGRSLFAVGDPMQSIYRFREAEVGLFLRARAEGIGNIMLQSITLSANFRSQSGIVDWVNTIFSQMMPKTEDIATGAVPYVPSVATHGVLSTAAVSIYPFFNKDYVAEAKQVGEIVAQSRRENLSKTVAVLVRNRGHLEDIVWRFKELGLRYRAVEIEALRFKPVVQDLLMLTRAVIHQADRLAWFSVLRAPWCGLALDDLHALIQRHGITTRSGEDKRTEIKNKKCYQTVWDLLNDGRCLSLLSVDGRNRLDRIREVLAPCISNRNRKTLRATIEAAWMALGGSGCMRSAGAANDQTEAKFEDAEIYFDYLERQEEAGSIPALATFEQGLAKLYALPDLEADETLQVMTIHKAKGLEFDIVIVPGLGRLSRGNDKKLLKWVERPRTTLAISDEESGVDLLLAPIQETGAQSDIIYTWLQKFEDIKTNFEEQRLLYVATTRAKHFLHLMGSVDIVANKEGEPECGQPRARTLLDKLWPAVQMVYSNAAKKALLLRELKDLPSEVTIVESKEIISQSLYRLESGWVLPPAPSAIRWHPPQSIEASAQEVVEFSWVGEVARHTGSVVHRWLQCIAEDELKGWNEARIQKLRGSFRKALILNGMSSYDKGIEGAVERVVTALTLAVNDQCGRWLLGPQLNAQNELRISAKINDKRVNIVIDRTFCTADGVRWIVDYKTSSHEGGGVAGFLNSEQARYSAQLNRYADLVRWKDKRPIRLGLYFPLLCGWREWELI